MQSKHEMTDGRRKLREILKNRPADSAEWNEATNRFQFVDRLLLECLGWQTPEIKVEQYDEAGGRTDYELGNPIRAILEAKRESRSFGDLPGGITSRVRKIEPLLEASKELRDAFTQCLTYCALKGARLGIVCNGPQLMIFQAVVQSGPPSEGECYFFDGFESYLEHFDLLWKLLSPEGVRENKAYRDIAIHRSPRLPQKASESIPDPLRHRYRSDFQENIRTLSTLLLEEIEENSEVRRSFYNDCYVSIEANSRHTMLSKQIISNRYKRVVASSSAPKSLRDRIDPNGKDGVVYKEASFEKGLSSSPFVVLGDVGVGKTSFFENLYFQLDDQVRDDTLFLHINLGQQGALTLDLRVFIIQEIKNLLRQNYSINIDSEDFIKAAHHKEIAIFETGPYKSLKEANPAEYSVRKADFLNDLVADRSSHLQASLGHLCFGQGRQLIVVLDNADQRNYETQQNAFLVAQELAAGGSALVFIALRPSTFYESKKRGALSGYQNKVFSITPPPADEVVQRRLQFAIRVAEGKQRLEALESIRFRLGGIVLFLRAALRSIRSNEEVKEFLGNITGGNVRSVIELISSFFGSPNVEAEKIIRIEEETGNYIVPLHELTKHALLGEYSYYNPQSSLYACNVFDVSTSDPREHFLKPLLVSFLYSNSGIKNRDGYVSGEAIISEMHKFGFSGEQTQNSLRKLARNRLIETPVLHYRETIVPDFEQPETFHYRVTSVGLYHIRKWFCSFSFLDAVSIDTPIFEALYRDKIVSLASSFNIADRHRKALAFREYLESQWLSADIGAPYFDFATSVRQGVPTFAMVERFLKKSSPK